LEQDQNRVGFLIVFAQTTYEARTFGGCIFCQLAIADQHSKLGKANIDFHMTSKSLCCKHQQILFDNIENAKYYLHF